MHIDSPDETNRRKLIHQFFHLLVVQTATDHLEVQKVRQLTKLRFKVLDVLNPDAAHVDIILIRSDLNRITGLPVSEFHELLFRNRRRGRRRCRRHRRRRGGRCRNSRRRRRRRLYGVFGRLRNSARLCGNIRRLISRKRSLTGNAQKRRCKQTQKQDFLFTTHNGQHGKSPPLNNSIPHSIRVLQQVNPRRRNRQGFSYHFPMQISARYIILYSFDVFVNINSVVSFNRRSYSIRTHSGKNGTGC